MRMMFEENRDHKSNVAYAYVSGCCYVKEYTSAFSSLTRFFLSLLVFLVETTFKKLA